MIFKFIFNIILLDIQLLFSTDFPELNVSNIKVSVFSHKHFIYLCIKFNSCLSLPFAVEFISAQMYG